MIYQRCPDEVTAISSKVLVKFETHAPLLSANVKIDFVFAFAPQDDQGKPCGIALKKNGVKCLGLCRIVPLKDRALGRGDAEISLDGDWWADASDEEREALLDHELHHISVRLSKGGAVLTDDHQRPLLRLRKHDVEVGWFDIVAARHGAHSMERQQARRIMDERGQWYWPEMGDGDNGQWRVVLGRVLEVA